MKNKKILIISIILIGGYILTRIIAGGSPPVSAREVEVENVIVSKTVSASGVVKSQKFAEKSFPITGNLTDVLVEKGDDVKKGQLLAVLFNTDLSQSAQSYKDARDVALRDKELFIEQYVNDKDALGGTEEYNIQLRRKEELLSKAEASYQSALGSLAKSYLYSPFEGTVIDVNLEPGEVASAGSTVITLADLKNPVFEVEVDQEDFGLLKMNQEVSVSLESYENVTFTGRVIDMPLYSDIEDSEGTDFVIKIKLETVEGYPILYGMNGDVKIVIETTEKKVRALPFDSIFTNGGSNPYVWVEKDGRLEQINVSVGIQGDLFTEVSDDFGDKVLVPADDKSEFEPGRKVKITE